MKTKTQLKWFTIFDCDKEQKYLRDMHKSGWKFVRKNPISLYYFEECEPEDVIYQFDYNKVGRANKEQYLQLFQDCGWEYLRDHAGFFCFRKPVSDDGVAEEIFCDRESKLQMMGRIFKGRMLPLLIIFFCLLLPEFLMRMFSHNYFAATIMGGCLALYIFLFAVCAVKYFSYKNGQTE